MKKVAIFLFLLFCLSVQSYSQDAEYKEAGKAMFEATGSGATFKVALFQMMSMSLEDMKAITEFYKTPAGKKLAQKTPLITQEYTKVGEKLGQGVAEKVLARLQEKGY